MKLFWIALGLVLPLTAMNLVAADNLKLNPNLDYSSDSLDGPLITGDNLQAGALAGKPNYVLIYGEACYNSKRQARRTVDLYNRYKGSVNFVIIDMDVPQSAEQSELVRIYYRGYIPHVAVIDGAGKALYNASGEVDSRVIESILDKMLGRK